MAFADNNNVLYNSEYTLSPTNEIKFQLLENKKSGQLNLSIREFINKENYSGPGKNGMFLKANTLEEVAEIQKQFNDFFENAKKYL